MSKQTESIDKKNTAIGIIVVFAIVIIVGIFFRSNSNKVSYEAPEVERPFLGNKDAAMVVTEYSDFACPACKKASPMLKGLLEKYGDQIKIEYRHLVSIHSNAFEAAVAAECANDQGKFWEYHDKLFKVNKDSSFTSENLNKYAEEVGLDITLWQTCIDSEERDKVVQEDSRKARALNFNGTPSFLLNGSPVKDWSKLDNMINMELNYLETAE